jgi:hypothetical protein
MTPSSANKAVAVEDEPETTEYPRASRNPFPPGVVTDDEDSDEEQVDCYKKTE